ncbi:MAG TPA: hypothetical protein VIK84_01985 [Haloplasmataceae bacterium]
MWQEYLDEEDEMGEFYTEEGIEEVSNALDRFIQGLIDLDDYNNNETIEELIKNVVLDINKISQKYDGMIETYEREELVDFNIQH